MAEWPEEAKEAYRNLRMQMSRCEKRETALRKALEEIRERGSQYSMGSVANKQGRVARDILRKVYGDEYEQSIS